MAVEVGVGKKERDSINSKKAEAEGGCVQRDVGDKGWQVIEMVSRQLTGFTSRMVVLLAKIGHERQRMGLEQKTCGSTF